MFNNMKKIILSAASLAVAAVASVSVAPTTSEAVPAFARQTGAACLNCHFGAIPRLAQMGREFRMNAFRDLSGDAIEDEHLSLPLAFNASLLMKARIGMGSGDSEKGGAVGGADTSIQWPDESALLFGGRIGEHAGGFQEWDVISGEMLGGKFAYVNDMDNGILAFAIGTSDALGAPSIFNDPSNAISRNTRGIQSRSMAMKGTLMHGAASGLGVYGYLNDSIYFAVGGLIPAGGYAAGNSGPELNLGSYVRVAWLGTLADFDAIIGAWNATAVEINPKAAAAAAGAAYVAQKDDKQGGVDIQLQGEVGGHQLGIYMPIVMGGSTSSGDATGFQLYANYNLAHAYGVQLGYDSLTSDAKDANAVILGGWYDLAQNIAINVEMKNWTNTPKVGAETSGTDTTIELEYVY